MEYKKEKIFWTARKHAKDVVCIPWDEREDYYSFVKKNIAFGYHQVSITSEIMLRLISRFLELGNWKIDKIEMMEDDAEINAILDHLIDATKNNSASVLNLYEYIRSFTEDSSIEIKRIYLSGRDNNGTLNTIFVQVNGIVGICNSEEKVNSIICSILREYI